MPQPRQASQASVITFLGLHLLADGVPHEPHRLLSNWRRTVTHVALRQASDSSARQGSQAVSLTSWHCGHKRVARDVWPARGGVEHDCTGERFFEAE